MGIRKLLPGISQKRLLVKQFPSTLKKRLPEHFTIGIPRPTTQFVLTLTGTLEFTVFSGEKFVLKAGEVLVAMDTTGSGHTWQMLGNEPWKRAYVVFEEEENIGFVKEG